MLLFTLAIQPAVAAERPRNPDLNRAVVTVVVHTGNPVNRFRPEHALGAGIDGHDMGDADRQLTAANIQEMISVGFKSLTYRLRTELANDVWHWNPAGKWSAPERKEGYWISDPTPSRPIYVSYGYRLPRRGNTIDQADNDGYSRLDDGDTESFWKSNPYLDQHFTGETNSKHPQWVVIDLGAVKKIDAIRLLWGIPFATHYEIQYANFDDISDISFNPPGMWTTFPRGRVFKATGGDAFLRLCSEPIEARFLRVLMIEASEKATSGSTDLRDARGYAIREIYAGTVNRKGEFQDQIRHSSEHDKQTICFVSSTDPWHREIDLDEEAEQPGLDRVFQSGLTNGLPLLIATGLLYDTPENAAAEIRYLKARSYAIERVELGEEPDGQYVTPEDYAALYRQFARVLHQINPKLQLGGPSFQEILPDETERAVKLGNSAWLARFIHNLETQGGLEDYSFFSFEWYPFDDVCDPVPPQLAQAAGMMSSALREMEGRGLSRRIPWIITEYGYSAFASRAEIGIEGALLNADIAGQFLVLGGDQAFLYGFTPGQVAHDEDCTAGNNMLFSMDSTGKITHHFATYFAARLLTQEWLGPANAQHEMYPANLDLPHRPGESLLSVYAVHRPDGLWSLLLINKDPLSAHQLRVRFHNDATGAESTFSGAVDLYQFSSAQYALSDDPNNPYPVRAESPAHEIAQDASTFELPAYSLTVIRGAGPAPIRTEER